MKTLVIYLISSLAVATLLAEEPVYETFGTDRLTAGQLSKDMSAAMKGDSQAARRVGRHYCGLSDMATGVRWLRLAAIGGDLGAQSDFFVFTKGASFADEMLVLEGKMWLHTACDAGYAHAIETRDAVLELGKKSDVNIK